MTRWLETDSLTNQNIATALAIGAYTADADRLILCQFFADQVAGNGDYDFWLTHQIAGSGSSYRYVPKTTATVASGVTAIAGQSIMVAVRSGDVLTAYLDGLAGDTTTPDTTVRWFEMAALRPATADRTLEIDENGYVAATISSSVDANLERIGNFILPSGTISGHTGNVLSTNLSFSLPDDTLRTGYTGWTVQFGYSEVAFPGRQGAWTTKVVSVSGSDVTVETMPSGSISTASKSIVIMPFDVSGGATIDGQDVADAMLLAPSGAAADGSVMDYLSDTPANVWSYATRTLTQSSTSTTDSTAAGSIARRRGDSWSISLTIGAITGYTSLWFTAKWDRDDTDSDAILQIKLNSSGTDNDLLYVNGATATDATKGTITVSDDTTGAIIIAVDETVTDDMPVGTFYYDIQALISGAVTTPDSGTFTITADVTRSVT